MRRTSFGRHGISAGCGCRSRSRSGRRSPIVGDRSKKRDPVATSSGGSPGTRRHPVVGWCMESVWPAAVGCCWVASPSTAGARSSSWERCRRDALAGAMVYGSTERAGSLRQSSATATAGRRLQPTGPGGPLWGDAPAAAHYQQALALAEALGLRPLQAHCHRSLGQLAATIGQAGRARSELATAIALYQSMAMTFWLPQTEATLAQVEP
jgi:hypothetical protein